MYLTCFSIFHFAKIITFVRQETSNENVCKSQTYKTLKAIRTSRIRFSFFFSSLFFYVLFIYFNPVFACICVFTINTTHKQTMKAVQIEQHPYNSFLLLVKSRFNLGHTCFYLRTDFRLFFQLGRMPFMLVSDIHQIK